MTIFDSNYNHTIRIYEPYRAKVIEVNLKRGDRVDKVKAVVTWAGSMIENETIDQLIETQKTKYNQVTNYKNKQKIGCFAKRLDLEKLTDELNNQQLLLDLEPAALTMYSLDSNFARTGGVSYYLNVCDEVGNVIKDRSYMIIEF